MMKRIFAVLFLAFLCFYFITGCSPKKEPSAEAAIEKSEYMKTVDEKVDYLTKQAKAFLESEEYKDSIEIARHILSNLDIQSENAKEILQECKDKLAQAVKDTINDTADKLKGFGK